MKIFYTNFFYISLLILSFGCSKDSTETDPPEIVYETAALHTHNFINSDINIDWHQDSKLLVENQAYAFGGTTDIKWEENKNSFSIATYNNADESVVATVQATVSEGNSYSCFAYGTAGNESILFSENNTTQPQSGSVRVQFMNLYHNLGGVDIYIGGETTNHKVVTNLTYGGKSDYFEFTKATIDARIIVTNTGVAPNTDTNLINIVNNDGHTVDKIYIDVLAGINFDSTSKLSFFETPQN